MAAKRTSELIPLCHPLPLSHVDVELEVGEGRVEITASAETTGADRRRDGGAHRGRGRRPDRLRHGEGDRQGDVITEITLVEKTKEEVLRAAVLTVSDRVSRGEAEDGSGDTLEELLRGRRLRGRCAGSCRTSATRSRARSPSSPRDADARAHDRRHRPRRARRDARGDRARCSSARRRGSPRRSGPTRSRRRRTACSRAASPARSAATLVVNLAGSPGALPRRLRRAAPGACRTR